MKNKLYFIAIALFFTGCQADEPQSVRQKTTQVETAAVRQVRKSWPIRSAAIIEADKNLKLSFKVGGIINQISVENGDRVKKGHILAKLNTIEIDAKVKQASLALDKAKRDFERVNNLYRDSVATKEQWQNTQTALDVARADLEMAQFNQQHATIKAPRDGIVLKKLAEAGEMIGAGYPVLVLGTHERQYRVVAQVTDREWVQIQTGDSAVVRMDAHPGKSFPAYVELINPLSEKYTGTYKTELRFTRIVPRVTTGMIARVEIFPKQKQTYLKIPMDALVEASGNQGYVFVLKDNQAARQTIKIARTGKQTIYVSEGLKPKDRVITTGKSYVSSGQKVEIIKKD